MNVSMPPNDFGSATVSVPSGATMLGDFVDKISGGQDSLTAILSASFQDQSLAASSERQLIRFQRVKVRRQHQRRMEAMKKYWEALSKRGFWSKLGFLGKILGALSLALAPVTGGASAVVGGVGAAVTGAGSIGESVVKRQIASAQVDKMMAQQSIDAGKAKIDTTLEGISATAEYEKNMVGRLQEMIEKQHSPALR